MLAVSLAAGLILAGVAFARGYKRLRWLETEADWNNERIAILEATVANQTATIGQVIHCHNGVANETAKALLGLGGDVERIETRLGLAPLDVPFLGLSLPAFTITTEGRDQ